MTPGALHFRPLRTASFGARADLRHLPSGNRAETLLEEREPLLDAFYAAGGLIALSGLGEIERRPDMLVRISEIFGSEVENYWETLTAERFLHETVRELLVLSNQPPCRHPPPPRPDPAFTEDGELVVSFPHQVNWHTDQSYRRPPPDASLLFAAVTPPRDQGQTLVADCVAAFDALTPNMQARLEGLNGLHAPSWVGRRPDDVRSGVTPKALLPHQRPQRQPLVRTHPVTGKKALYICEEKQMDYVEGPIVGLETGPEGEGAQLIRDLLRHATQRQFVYAHEWAPGDLLILDNRSLLHAATWYDADTHPRLMWRTTVMGDAGADYAGEAKSWIPQDGRKIMEGMEDA